MKASLMCVCVSTPVPKDSGHTKEFDLLQVILQVSPSTCAAFSRGSRQL